VHSYSVSHRFTLVSFSPIKHHLFYSYLQLRVVKTIFVENLDLVAHWQAHEPKEASPSLFLCGIGIAFIIRGLILRGNIFYI
jgi:hypothetical protein